MNTEDELFNSKNEFLNSKNELFSTKRYFLILSIINYPLSIN
jgi:hypothetical protein